MQPIQPVGSNSASNIAAVTEAVARYGVSEDLKETVRREAPVETPTLPADKVTVQFVGEAVPQGPAPGQDGQKEAQEAALAQHSAEQQGRQELRWTDSRHTQRSTREQVSKVEGGPEETEGPSKAKHSPQGHVASGGHAGGKSGGAHAPSGGGQGSSAPNLGANVLAAAVGSGLTSSKELAADEARGFELDDSAEQVDSSQQATSAQMANQGKQRADRGGMQTSLGFGGDKDEEKKEFNPGGGSQQGASEDREQPRREAPSLETQGSEAAASEATPADTREAGEPEPVTAAAPADSSSVSPAAATDQAPSTQPTPSKDQPAHEATSYAGLDSVERHVYLSPGIEEASADEYFFFDDAREVS